MIPGSETSTESGASGPAADPDRTEKLAQAVALRLAGRVTALPGSGGELTYEVAPEHLLEVAQALRDTPELRFEMCMDVCGVDYLQYGQTEWKTTAATATGFSRGRTRPVADLETPVDETLVDEDGTSAAPAGRRFAVVYHLLSISLNHRLRLRVLCPDDVQPIVDSVCGVWASADWFERETFDLFGILFNGHPDLRRLLTDYGFIGHPFRKDFPLTGNVEVRYDPEKGRVVYQPVTIDPRILVPRVIRHDNRYDPQLTNAKPNG